MKKRIMSMAAAAALSGGAILAAGAPANATVYEGGGSPDSANVVTTYISHDEVQQMQNQGSLLSILCKGLPAGWGAACGASYAVQWPDEISDAALRGCDIYERTEINNNSTGSWDRSKTTYSLLNCDR